METHKIVIICATIVLASFFLTIKGCDANDPEEAAAMVKVIKAEKEKEVELAQQDLAMQKEVNRLRLEKLKSIKDMVDKGVPAAAAHCAVFGPTNNNNARAYCLQASKLPRTLPRAK